MAKGKKSNKFVNSIQTGLMDIKNVLEEGNYKLFLKQLVVIILLIFGYRYVNDMFNQQNGKISSQIDAVYAQKNNEQEYVVNKKKLLELEPRFPNLEEKNDWLFRQIVSIFDDSPVTPSIGSTQNEDENHNGYVLVSLPVDLEISYNDLGALMAKIENKGVLLRISELYLNKKEDEMGINTVHLQFNTIFPKEKIAKIMFKDEMNANAGGGK